MKFGIEIEAVGMTLDQVARLLNDNGIACENAGYTHRVMQGWKVVTDGSLGHACGFELVSPPMEYNADNLALVKKVCNLLNNAGCGVTRRCGLHIHFDVSAFENDHVANIFNRYKKFEAKLDAMMPTSRRANNNQYCQSLGLLRDATPCATISETLNTTGQFGRYYKVNLQSFVKYGTIEFRQHSGSCNGAKVCKWIKFLAQFIEASKPVEVEVTVEQQVTTQPSDTALRGKAKAIVDLLRTRQHGMTAEDIAQSVGSTRGSVQSMICRQLRNAGVTVRANRGYYRLYETLPTQTITATTTRRSLPTDDQLFRGVDADLVAYYETRVSVLAA